MTNTKDLRAEVAEWAVTNSGNSSHQLGLIEGATSPDSPLLKFALELIEKYQRESETVAPDALYRRHVREQMFDGFKKIRECMEEMGK